jgi:hypothetical protein
MMDADIRRGRILQEVAATRKIEKHSISLLVSETCGNYYFLSILGGRSGAKCKVIMHSYVQTLFNINNVSAQLMEPGSISCCFRLTTDPPRRKYNR